MNYFNKKALDIGCGSGILSFILMKTLSNLKVTGIDKNKSAVDCAK
jgi:methylase of polypeptide subunit release factors